jgi:uncharacterized membrane protein (DUF4010 family)
VEFEGVFSRMALALGIGLLFGLERGWRTRDAAAGSRSAGIRTFALSGLLGGITGAIAQVWLGAASIGGSIVLAAGFATYAAVMTVFVREENRADNTFSATTAVAGMLTYLLGAYAFVGDMRIAAGAAVAATALLAVREGLHGWVASINWPELRSGLVLLAMTFIALPIVPNDPIGPFGGVNPREVWAIAVVLAFVSFIGYASVKYLGPNRGILLAAAAGGLVSSTAVTVTNARRAAAGEAPHGLLVAGVAASTAVSLFRMLAILAALQPGLLTLVGPALVAAALAAVGFAVVSVSRSTAGGQPHLELNFQNPFGFWNVVGFALLLAAIIVLGRAVSEAFGAVGAVSGAVLVGLADVDSVTVSVARMTPGPLTMPQAAYAILAATGSNTFTKAAIGASIGRGRFAAGIAAMASGCMIAAGLVFGLTIALLPG